MSETNLRWWNAKADELAGAVSRSINDMERTQLDVYERYYRLAFLYDPYDYLSRWWFPYEYQAFVTENICASNVDTVTSVVARSSTRPVFLTDEADWKTKRRASDLGRFAEGLAKKLRLDQHKSRIFKDAAIFGPGFLHQEMDAEGNLAGERFLPVEVRVSEEECLSQSPRHLHLLKYRDREWLAAKYPGKAKEIEAAPKDTSGSWFGISGLYATDQVLVRISYRLPIGTFGKPGYKAGRKVVSTGGLILLDEDYDDDRFPLSVLRWNERTTGWMGGGLVESLMGTQRTINKMNAAIDVQIDFHASPVTYVNVNDLAMVEKMRITKVGRFVPYAVAPPETKIPPVIAPEVVQRLVYLKQGSRENAGISDIHSHGALPARLETGAAIRESNDVASERFAIQEKAVEWWYLDCIEVALMLCKRNATKKLKTPDIGYSFSTIQRRIHWGEVDMGDIRYWIQAAPQLSRTLAGRMDTIAAWTNQGLISPDDARRLIRHPDLDSAMSLYDAYLDNIERTADLLLSGHYMPPDPRGPLEIGLDAMQRYYFRAVDDGAPEQDLENVRGWMDQAAFILSKRQAPQQAPAPMLPVPEGAANPLMG